MKLRIFLVVASCVVSLITGFVISRSGSPTESVRARANPLIGLPKDRKKKIVRIYGAKTDNNARLYKRGQDKVLAPVIDRGEIEVVHEDWTQDWKPENAKKIASAAITKAGANFDAILASNDGTAGGAIQALSEEGLAGKVLVTGQDAELSACQRIVNGTQAMTIRSEEHTS